MFEYNSGQSRFRIFPVALCLALLRDVERKQALLDQTRRPRRRQCLMHLRHLLQTRPRP